ncbi:hypothetical protein [uncultured Proteiniphilum sp.]|nr:hypothetical protein [uncultured Proteiniphilum sp.]
MQHLSQKPELAVVLYVHQFYTEIKLHIHHISGNGSPNIATKEA